MIPVYKSLWNIDNEEGEKPPSTKKLSRSLCSWSSKNWIAFTTGKGNANENSSSSRDANTVYVMNPDQPWEVYPVNTQHRGIIEHLEWDHGGSCFVTVDATGGGKIWRRDDSLINQWTCQDSEVLQFSDGSQVRKILWLDETKHFSVDFEKAGKREWFQKFPQSKSESMYSSSNGQTNTGFIVVTLEGLLKVFLLAPNQKPIVHTTRLGSLKSNVLMADFIQNESGKIFVAIVTDPCTVELFTVSFKESINGIEIVVEVWPCIVPSRYGDPGFEPFTTEAVKCVKRCNNQTLSTEVLVLCKGDTFSLLKCFGIRKELVKLHQRFPAQQQYADACCCLSTVQIAGSPVNNMFVTNLHFGSTPNVHTALLPKVVLTGTNGFLQVYSLQSFQQIVQPSTIEELKRDGINSAVFSKCDHALFAVSDHGNPMMFVLPHNHANSPGDKIKNVKYITGLLQWSIMESYVPWDVMLGLASKEKSFVDQCLQQFHSDYFETGGTNTNSNHNMYQMFYWGYWKIKALFYAANKDYVGVFESHNLMFLHNVYLFVVTNLQSEKEVLLLEKINQIVTLSKKEVELVKILQVIDTKDVVFSSLANASNRPVIQWLTDYMIHIIRLLLSTNHHKQQDWKQVLHYFDSASFMCLRKLCVLLFILYQKSSAHNIQPIYITMVNSLDVLPQLFKLITRLYIASLSEPTTTAAAAAQSDLVTADLPFCSLPIMYMEYPSENPRGSVLSQSNLATPPLHSVPQQQQQQHAGGIKDFNYYDIQLKCDPWELIQSTALGNPLVNGILPVNTQLRQIYDGINFAPSSLMQGEQVKQCCQCGTLTIYNCHTSRVLNELWSTCWREHCVCGGFWKKVL